MKVIRKSIPLVAGLTLLAALTSCGGRSSSVQYTNDATTEQLNQISANTADDDGSGQAQDTTDPRQGMGVATKPRKY